MTAATAWSKRRSYDGRRFGVGDLVAAKAGIEVSVVVPAKNVAATIGEVVGAIRPLAEASLVDELVVIDGSSSDATAAIAAAAGARVHDESDLLTEFGPALGKGDAMWRSLAVTGGDIVVFVDGDSERFQAGFVTGLLGPLLIDPVVVFVKGAYRRPFCGPDAAPPVPDAGGRVTELMARPLLNRFFPELTGVRQPLAGEVAGRREVLERIPFAAGYAVEIQMLIDVLNDAGLDAIAQVDLGERRNRHQALRDLGPMAYAILNAVLDRAGATGTAEGQNLAAGATALDASPVYIAPIGGELRSRPVPLCERPPLRTLASDPATATAASVGATS